MLWYGCRQRVCAREVGANSDRGKIGIETTKVPHVRDTDKAVRIKQYRYNYSRTGQNFVMLQRGRRWRW